MLCSKCHQRESVFHSTTIINGIASEEHLCSHCVDESKLNSFNGFVDDLFSSPFDLFTPELFGLQEFMPINQIPHESRVDKYSEYKGVLDQAMQSVRTGAKSTTTLTPKEVDLRIKLADAVSNEEYELASQIKKELDSLKNNGKEE